MPREPRPGEPGSAVPGGHQSPPLEEAHVTRIVSKVWALLRKPNADGKVRLILKWRHEDSGRVFHWLGAVGGATLASETSGVSSTGYVDITAFTHQIKVTDDEGVDDSTLIELTDSVSNTFPADEWSTAERVTETLTDGSVTPLVYYGAIAFIDTRETGEPIQAFYFRNAPDYDHGRAGPVTLFDSVPVAIVSRFPSPAASEAGDLDASAIDADDFDTDTFEGLNAKVDVVGGLAEQRYKDLRQELNKVKVRLRNDTLASLSTSDVESLRARVLKLETALGDFETRLSAAARDARDVRRINDDLQTQIDSSNAREKALAARLDKLEALREQDALLRPAAAGAAPRRAQRGDGPVMSFEYERAETYPTTNTTVAKIILKKLVDVPRHKDTLKSAFEALCALWKARNEAILVAQAVGADEDRIAEIRAEKEALMQKQIVAFMAMRRFAEENPPNCLEKMKRAAKLAEEQALVDETSVDVAAFMKSVEEAVQARGPLASKASPKKSSAKAAAKDKGGSNSGNSAGSR